MTIVPNGIGNLRSPFHDLPARSRCLRKGHQRISAQVLEAFLTAEHCSCGAQFFAGFDDLRWNLHVAELAPRRDLHRERTSGHRPEQLAHRLRRARGVLRVGRIQVEVATAGTVDSNLARSIVCVISALPSLSTPFTLPGHVDRLRQGRLQLLAADVHRHLRLLGQDVTQLLTRRELPPQRRVGPGQLTPPVDNTTTASRHAPRPPNVDLFIARPSIELEKTHPVDPAGTRIHTLRKMIATFRHLNKPSGIRRPCFGHADKPRPRHPVRIVPPPCKACCFRERKVAQPAARERQHHSRSPSPASISARLRVPLIAILLVGSCMWPLVNISFVAFVQH